MPFSKLNLRVAVLGVAIGISGDAHCGIIPSPSGFLVKESYLTDTATGLEWYKFDNSISTIGLSFREVTNNSSVFSAMGWRPASVAEVSALWSRFGYKSDTDATPGTNENSGLADAVGSLLGYTYQRDFPTGSFIRNVIGLSSSADASGRIYQSSLFVSSFVRDYAGLANDPVPSIDYSWVGTGTYLVRKAPEAFYVPEPDSTDLFLLASLTAITASRGRSSRVRSGPATAKTGNRVWRDRATYLKQANRAKRDSPCAWSSVVPSPASS
jgi:hypothetical protein